jgi:hypothetical protein
MIEPLTSLDGSRCQQQKALPFLEDEFTTNKIRKSICCASFDGKNSATCPSFVFDVESKAIPGFKLEILSHDKKIHAIIMQPLRR